MQKVILTSNQMLLIIQKLTTDPGDPAKGCDMHEPLTNQVFDWVTNHSSRGVCVF